MMMAVFNLPESVEHCFCTALAVALDSTPFEVDRQSDDFICASALCMRQPGKCETSTRGRTPMLSGIESFPFW